MGFLIFDQLCVPRKNPTWSWCIIFLMWYWNLLSSILSSTLYQYLSLILVYNFFFVFALRIGIIHFQWSGIIYRALRLSGI